MGEVVHPKFGIDRGEHEGSVDRPRGGGDNGKMDRLDHLEKRVDQIDGRLSHIEGDVSTLRTDSGLIKNSLADLRIGIAEMNAKFNIGEIRANVEKSHTDIYKWIATLAISSIGLMAAVYFGMQRGALAVPTATVQTPYLPPAPPTGPASVAPAPMPPAK